MHAGQRERDEMLVSPGQYKEPLPEEKERFLLSSFCQSCEQAGRSCERQRKRAGRRDELLLRSPAQAACGQVRAVVRVSMHCSPAELYDKGPLPLLPMCPRSGPLLYVVFIER